MTAWTVLEYLTGSRAAVEQVAANPWAFWVGLALTVSAGLARSYASRDLARQPWHLVLPAVAALGVSFALACLLAPTPPVPAGKIRSIASLELLTAPLAWLYAIPFERFLSPLATVRARLSTLAVVATWRVGLLVRAVSILLDDQLGTAFCLVLWLADAIMLGALLFNAMASSQPTGKATPQLMMVMSAIEPVAPTTTESTLVSRATICVAIIGVLTFPLWYWCANGFDASALTWHRLLAAPVREQPRLGAWVLAAAPLVGFAALLPWTQRAPRLRSRVEDLWREGEWQEAVAVMTAHRREEFPPGWSPPPTWGFRDPPALLDVLELALGPSQPAWLREAYLEKLRVFLSDPLWYFYYDEDLEKLARILQTLPEGSALAAFLLDAVTRHQSQVMDEPLPLNRDNAAKVFEGFRLFIHPEPTSTGRREEILSAIRQLAG